MFLWNVTVIVCRGPRTTAVKVSAGMNTKHTKA
jgi:hypothetical protein